MMDNVSMAAWIGLLGVLAGALIAFGGQYLMRRDERQERNITLLLEQCAVIVALSYDFRNRVWEERNQLANDLTNILLRKLTLRAPPGDLPKRIEIWLTKLLPDLTKGLAIGLQHRRIEQSRVDRTPRLLRVLLSGVLLIREIRHNVLTPLSCASPLSPLSRNSFLVLRAVRSKQKINLRFVG